MPNYRRAIVPGGTFFFTIVAYQRRRFLTSALARRCLRLALRAVRATRPFKIEAIVLLPDHLHLVMTLPPDDADYSYRLSRVKAKFTADYLSAGGNEYHTTASRNHRGERGVWQRRFFEHVVRDEHDFKRCVDYVHVNPVKHGVVDRVRDWPWSSFHRYVQLGEYTPDWGGGTTCYGDEWNAYE